MTRVVNTWPEVNRYSCAISRYEIASLPKSRNRLKTEQTIVFPCQLTSLPACLHLFSLQSPYSSIFTPPLSLSFLLYSSATLPLSIFSSFCLLPISISLHLYIPLSSSISIPLPSSLMLHPSLFISLFYSFFFCFSHLLFFSGSDIFFSVPLYLYPSLFNSPYLSILHIFISSSSLNLSLRLSVLLSFYAPIISLSLLSISNSPVLLPFLLFSPYCYPCYYLHMFPLYLYLPHCLSIFV